MIKDQIRLYCDFSQFKPCPFCLKKSHLSIKCPRLFYIPDGDFLIKKLNYCPVQNRKIFKHFSQKKRFNSLKSLFHVQTSMMKFQAFTEVIEDESEMGGSYSNLQIEQPEIREENTENDASGKENYIRKRRGDTRKNGIVLPKEKEKEKTINIKSFKFLDSKIGLLGEEEKEKNGVIVILVNLSFFFQKRKICKVMLVLMKKILIFQAEEASAHHHLR